MTAGAGGTPEEGRPLSATVSFQVRSLIAAAERSAAALRAQTEQQAEQRLRDADEEARRRVEEARREADDLLAARRSQLSQLSDAVAARAERLLAELDSAGQVREALDDALHSLTEAAGSLSGEWTGAQPKAPVPERAQEVPAEWSGAGEPARSEPAAAEHGSSPGEPAPIDGSGFTGPRLVAHQMAQAGSTRAEVAAHLRRTFGLHDAHDVLNDAFPASRAAPPG